MRLLASSAALTCVLLLAGGCGDAETVSDDTPGAATSSATTGATEGAGASPSGSASEGSEEPAGTVVPITIEGDTVSPEAQRLPVSLDETVTLEITADAPGEIHVHSTPEQELEYDEGTTDLELTFEQPGVVEVESHDLGLTILQLEVS
ncbi:hypothetical protein [Nocardioides kribbensis]|uniref:EfeO-type cupredoxin-like domain-containing protein n=1 Tax=Nocardioides kribbensis TaxID=305517 RepID=A0ABV1P018_9ACTN